MVTCDLSKIGPALKLEHDGLFFPGGTPSQFDKTEPMKPCLDDLKIWGYTVKYIRLIWREEPMTFWVEKSRE